MDDYDVEGVIFGRYVNIIRIVECLRNMVYCSKGRFYWFREIGKYINKYKYKYFL